MWDPSLLNCDEVIKDRFFLCVGGTLVASGTRINLVNVYAPNIPVARRVLWEELVSLRNSRQGLWVFMGDFNDVRSPEERFNSEYVASNAEAFNDFILAAALLEPNMGGARFTYMSDQGDKLSKLDRFLVCIGLVENWPTVAVQALDRAYTDHRPLLLTMVPSDYGHIPFRFYNSWFELHGFVDFVLEKCRSFSFDGPADLALATKLRWLKNRIKEWISNDRREREEQYWFRKNRVRMIEILAEDRSLNQLELEMRTTDKHFIMEYERLKELDTKQKSRVRWGLEGDENTRYFHSTVNANISSNSINGVLIDGVWETNPTVVKQHFFGFYESIFAEPVSVRPSISCPNISVLSDEDASSLISPFSLREIKDAVWDCDGDRAPGPDGFNFKFIKRCWSGLEGDFAKIFEEFFVNPHINRSCTSSFIALIPKVKDPMRPSDFRPISLIGCINKVISKVLVNRLKRVIGKVISEDQTAFLKGRSITDGPLILNELFAWMKSTKKMGMFYKVDIHKAYDSLHWGFLRSIMEQMGFPMKWCDWIMATLCSARASVLVNGSPTPEFDCSRGLRQGDPLSPFLFVIAMEALTGIMKKASMAGLYHGIRCNTSGPILSHFLYADDVVFLGEWSTTNALNLRRILRCFNLASGLRVNLSKCSLYGVGVGDHEVSDMAYVLRCRAGSFPFRYLGLLVGANMNLVKNWDPVIKLFKNRLSIWKAKTLSFGGRITLIKSVLSALPTYFFSLYKAPLQVLKQLERLRRVFFWGGSEEKAKLNWTAWEKTIGPIEYGGLGFGSLQDANLAMLSKWWWRFKVDRNGLWRKVIWALHQSSRAWTFIPTKVSIIGPWKQITRCAGILETRGIDLSKSIIGILGSGVDIYFWVDIWFGTEPLASLFPNLFAIERNKLCCVAARVQEFGVCQWSWKRIPAGSFSVNSVKKKIQSHGHVMPNYVIKWNNWVPKKIGIVAWRAEGERLPTRKALARRGIPVSTTVCALCGELEETCEHLFVTCQFAQIIWHVIGQWCKYPALYAFCFRDVLDFYKWAPGGKKKRKAFQAITLITIWCIWKQRNEIVYGGSQLSVANVVEEIKSRSFFWVRIRAKELNITWDAWKKFDVF
ncbi:putative RNA-directed DNA polymerase [Helianthus annuus]|nr:putative RNA-directed DNA polymerase [Helianthus annuus]KAJ0445927.1 putative RNA-directed DNA polymerase [Helianthus annuus]KAJ0630891.1 putative RNA-directed DNA polymerase [Helianthus annuus]